MGFFWWWTSSAVNTTFNSLFEIPLVYASRFLKNWYVNFQFSFWDSAGFRVRLQKRDRHRYTFQFSFWDSAAAYVAHGGAGRELFQFSFWDSYPYASPDSSRTSPLSILFLRFKMIFCCSSISFKFTFNSLFEIPPPGIWRSRVASRFPFNSLFEIRGRPRTPPKTSRPDTFNSLFEILHICMWNHDGAGIWLSILFLRFWRKHSKDMRMRQTY